MATHTVTPQEWTGDAAVLVYAARYAMRSRRCHAGQLMRLTLEANAAAIPAGIRGALTRDITRWLDGEGLTHPPAERGPWLVALNALNEAATR